MTKPAQEKYGYVNLLAQNYLKIVNWAVKLQTNHYSSELSAFLEPKMST